MKRRQNESNSRLAPSEESARTPSTANRAAFRRWMLGCTSAREVKGREELGPTERNPAPLFYKNVSPALSPHLSLPPRWPERQLSSRQRSSARRNAVDVGFYDVGVSAATFCRLSLKVESRWKLRSKLLHLKISWEEALFGRNDTFDIEEQNFKGSLLSWKLFFFLDERCRRCKCKKRSSSTGLSRF